MWKIDSVGNAYNPDTGENAFVVIGVVKQVDGKCYRICDFKSEDVARHFVKSYADRLNEEERENARHAMDKNPD